jgi:predicted enzyme related to lactoylglutathione lyase
MSKPTSKFFWYELMTSDPAAAESFYRSVIGWGVHDSGMKAGPEGSPLDFKYTIFTAGETGVAGMMKLPDGCSEAEVGWLGYIWVDDTDAYAERINVAGGKVMREPDDIPGIGRFAVVTDPHGAVFVIMTPTGEAPADYPAPNTTGLIEWHELHAGNGPEAFDFYSELFGWQKGGSMDMGELGVYQMFRPKESSEGGEECNDCGAIMTKMPDTPAPFWAFYINVPAIGSAIERVKENGGQIIMGPHEVPGPAWIAQCLDPQGGLFAMVASTP